tara:strand:+ start:292 stop:486 length:195 start_codon:yes stop_codon:yes gene_type:complete
MKSVKNVEEAQEVTTQLTEQESQSLEILIQAVKIATKSGTFELEDAVVIGTAKGNLEKLILKKS